MLVIGMVLGYKLNESGANYSLIEKITSDEGLSEYGRVEEVIRFIEHKYAYDLDTDQLTDDALTAVVNNLDPFSNYIAPSELQAVNNRTSGVYHGIGIETIEKDSSFFIAKLYKGSPAKNAGLHQFDEIITINDINLRDSSLNISQIKNVLGDYDSLDFVVQRDDQRLDVVIKEGDIPLSPVSISTQLSDDTYYLKIDAFSEGVYRTFMDSIENLGINKEDHKLIIDVRGNRGGLLPDVANILSQLITEENITLVTTQGEHQKEEKYSSTGKAFFQLGDIAVLIDEGSASASEILAGAIQDLDRGIVVGMQSYGKGLVQEQYLLSNNGALRLTVAEYFLPSGRCIQRERVKKESTDTTIVEEFKTLRLARPLNGSIGIEPDIKVELGYALTSQERLAVQQWAYDFAYANKNKTTDFWLGLINDPTAVKDAFNNMSKITVDESPSNQKLLLLDALNYYEVFADKDLKAAYLSIDPVVKTSMKQLSKENIFNFDTK